MFAQRRPIAITARAVKIGPTTPELGSTLGAALILWMLAVSVNPLAAQSIGRRSFTVGDFNGVTARCALTVFDRSGNRNENWIVARPMSHELSVTVLNGLADTAASVDATFNAASTLMQQDSGASDSNCCVEIRRDGGVTFVATPVTGGVINNNSDLQAVRGLAGDLKVVAAINFCGQGGTFAGCRSGNDLVVTTGFGAATIAHELGHREGLCHVATSCNPTCGQAGTCSGCGDASSNNIMYFRVCNASPQDRFTSSQCSSFQGGASN